MQSFSPNYPVILFGKYWSPLEPFSVCSLEISSTPYRHYIDIQTPCRHHYRFPEKGESPLSCKCNPQSERREILSAIPFSPIPFLLFWMQGTHTNTDFVIYCKGRWPWACSETRQQLRAKRYKMYYNHRNWHPFKMPKEEKRSKRVTGPSSRPPNNPAKTKSHDFMNSRSQSASALLWMERVDLHFCPVALECFPMTRSHNILGDSGIDSGHCPAGKGLTWH